MAKINGKSVKSLPSFISKDEDKPLTETEQVFGLADEDTALSMEEYYAKDKKDYERQAEKVLEEYTGTGEAIYDKEYLRSLDTNSMLNLIYDEDRDLVKKYTDPTSKAAREQEFVLKAVPRNIAPYVRVVAKGSGYVVVRPLDGLEDVITEGIAKGLSKDKEIQVMAENISADTGMSFEAALAEADETRETADARETILTQQKLKSNEEKMKEFSALVKRFGDGETTEQDDKIIEETMRLVDGGVSEVEAYDNAIATITAPIYEPTGTGSLTPYDPTLRQKHQLGIQSLLEWTGTSKNTARHIAKGIVGDPTVSTGRGMGADIMESLGAADLTPFGALYGLDEASRDIEAINARDGSATEYIVPGVVAGLSILEAIPLTKAFVKGGKRVVSGKPSVSKTSNEIAAEVDAEEIAFKEAQANRKYNLGRVIEKTREFENARKEAARVNAAKNSDVLEDFIDAYEETHKVNIHRVVDGKKVIDYEKARNVGISRMIDLDLPDDEISALGFGPDGHRIPMLNPDTIDPLIAVVADLKAANPEMFKNVKKTKKKYEAKTDDGRTIIGTEKGEPEDRGLNVIEALFEASAKGEFDLLNSPVLDEALEKYGLSLDEFIQQVVGAGSMYGKGLQKFKAVKDAMQARKSPAQIAEEEMNEALKNAGGIRQGIKRFEDIVRGAMVGTIATAMRNFEGFLIRAPLEGLTNLFTNGIHAGASAASGNLKPLKGFVTENPFKNNFRVYGEMFRDRKGIKEYADYILGNEKFRDLYTRMYEQVNEIRVSKGRGQAKTKVGKGFDYTLSAMEDFVHFINGPNRMQEFLARRTVFMDKLNQLVKREYDLDLMQVMDSGRFEDLMRDNKAFVGKDTRPFKELVTDAVDASLDATYASGPKNAAFQYLLKGFNYVPGSTFIVPFPRFMFKSMEYMYETTLGLPTAMTRKIFGLGEAGGSFVTASGKATYNAEMAARGMAGWSAIGTMYMAAEAGLITDDNKLRIPGTNKVIDVTPQFPLAQLAYLGNGMRKMISSERDFNEWFDGKEFVKLFTGTNFRNNTGLGELIDDIFQMASGEAKIGTKEALAESVGKFFGDITTRIAQPYQQVIDIERGLGFRDKTIRDYSSDPDMSIMGSFSKGFTERVQSRGFTTQEGGLTGYIGENVFGVEPPEDLAPAKAYPTKPGEKEREFPLLKFGLGLNIMDDATEEQEFLLKYGYRDWDFRSRTGVGTVDNAINETMSGVLPSMVKSMMKLEEKFIEQGKSEEFIDKEIKARIKQMATGIKSKIYKHGIKSKGADNPAYVQELFKLRTYNAEAQSAIVARFYDMTGKHPDLSDVTDLRKLNDIGLRGRYKRSLF